LRNFEDLIGDLDFLPIQNGLSEMEEKKLRGS